MTATEEAHMTATQETMATTTTERVDSVSAAAYRIRHHALNMGEVQGQGYVGQALGAADMLAAVYADQLRFRADDPNGKGGTGSCSPPATTRSATTRPWPRPASSRSRSWRPTARTIPGCPMSGMSTYTPGMEISGGSLGHGLTIAVGMALGLRYQGSDARVYNFLSDGELDEGSTWEAAMGAHHHQLGNLTAMVDINALQADGKTDTVLRTEPVTEKWESFGWYTQRVDGNDMAALLQAFDNAAAQAAAVGRPSVILCDTKVGRGVPLLEEREKAHFMRIEEHEWQLCREQLTAGYEGKAKR